MLSRPLSNERVELSATGSPVVPKLPLAQSSASVPESQRLSYHRFIIAHKTACLKAEALIHSGAADPSRLTPGHTDPAHSLYQRRRPIQLEKDLHLDATREKIDLESIKAKKGKHKFKQFRN